VITCGKSHAGPSYILNADEETRHFMFETVKKPVVTGIVVSTCWAAFVSGEHLEFAKAPAQQMLTGVVGTTSLTSSAQPLIFNTTTFAQVDPPPPVVPPGDRQQQG
jgi:hypothetical protein